MRRNRNQGSYTRDPFLPFVTWTRMADRGRFPTYEVQYDRLPFSIGGSAFPDPKSEVQLLGLNV